MKLSLKIGALLVFVSFSCTSTNFLENVSSGAAADLKGMIYNLDRKPVSSVAVRVSQDPTSQPIFTDIHGRFSIPNVKFGSLTLYLQKDEYEPFEWKFDFTEASQVVYVQIANADQLFSEASDLIEKNLLNEAQAAIDRGRKLAPGSSIGAYLQGMAFAEKGEYEQAADFVEHFLQTSRPNFTLDLFLADVYEKKLKNYGKALYYLKAAAEKKFDPEVEQRIAQLSGPKT